MGEEGLAQRLLPAMDTDADGVVSMDEFRNAFEKGLLGGTDVASAVALKEEEEVLRYFKGMMKARSTAGALLGP